MFFNNEFASRYDGLVKKQNWYGSEVLFGMIFEYIQMKDKILDIGIYYSREQRSICTSNCRESEEQEGSYYI